jgi:hypothetical protein
MQTGPKFMSRLRLPYWWATLACGAILGALIWVASEPLTGHREPWDADHAYFLLIGPSLVASGRITRGVV